MHISSPSSRVTGIIKWLGLMFVSACLLNDCAMQHKPSLMLHGYIGLDPCKMPVTEMQLYFALGNFGLGESLLYSVVKVFCPKIIFCRCEVWGRNLLFRDFGLGDFFESCTLSFNLFVVIPCKQTSKGNVHSTTAQSSVVIEEVGCGGIGWQSHCFPNATESCSTVYI